MKTPLIWIRQASWTLWLALALAALLGLRSCWAEEQQQREVSVVGYNYTNRPIYTFTVNDGAGSNIFINGGGAGSASCCTLITVGQPVLVEWKLSATEKQYLAGIRMNERSTHVVAPPPPAEYPQARYLEVHFYQDGHVELALSDYPSKRRLPKIPEEN